MKILIANDGFHAHYFERMAWVKAFKSVGHDVAYWDCKNVPAFDVFNGFEPEIFIGQSYNLDRATIKCIKVRPHLKVALRAGDWGDHEKKVDKRYFNILYATPEEKQILADLKKETGQPEFVFIHYDDNAIKVTHNGWQSIGIRAVSMLMSASVEEYLNSQQDEKYICDLGFVGGYWPYKGQVIAPYLFPLLNKNLNIKVFGNQVWPIPQYCGLIQDNDVKNLFKSAAICPNFSEPHAQAFGIDINERCFKVLCSGGFCISDNVGGLKRLFEDKGVVFADSAEHFHSLVEFFLNNPKLRGEISNRGRREVLDKHTSFHRIGKFLDEFGIEHDILSAWARFRKANGL